jgi:hypothetical protein
MWYSPFTAAGKKILVASNKNADDTVVNSCSIFWGVTQGCNGGGLMWGCRERKDLLRSASHVKWGKWGSKPHRVLGCHVSTKGNPRGRHLLSIYADISYKKKFRPDWSPNYFTSSYPHQRLHIPAFYLKYQNSIKFWHSIWHVFWHLCRISWH